MLPAFAQTAAAFDPHTFTYTPYGYNHSLTSYGTPISSMPQSYYQETYNKSESDSTPEEKKKDPLSVNICLELRKSSWYLAKRHKNNLAAQKSRKIRKQREESITKTAELLRVENESLKNEIIQLREMIADLRKQLNSTCQHSETSRDVSNISRDVNYNPYQSFQIGFTTSSEL
ncbi:basic region leucine zipper [Dictyocaulus viviparus]|uniref:Basic region leucine zipper n=1 Tax=Dictyocaulus viviparus TaxID=29172 RepID=A0A0D8XWS0_DICVI|nr:basic region leucine zipper [Dictyocaulus viviparus]